MLPTQPARLLVLLSVLPKEVRSPSATGFVCKLGGGVNPAHSKAPSS